MAKFAKVGYGSDGRGLGSTEDGYTYVVNDNVRTGDRLQPVATNWRSGKKFVTTGVALHSYKENSVKGVEAKVDAQSRTGEDPTKIYTAKELGASGSKKSTLDESTGKSTPSKFTQSTRAGNLAMYVKSHPDTKMTEHAYETFDAYSKKYMKQENNYE